MKPSWNQPICDVCWVQREGDRVATRLTIPDEETCAICGRQTMSGIYQRINPEEVPFPRMEPVE